MRAYKYLKDICIVVMSVVLVAATMLTGPTLTVRAAGAATFVVNSLTDEPNINPSSGVTCVSTPSGACTLRAAVEAANNIIGPVTINLIPGTYNLSLGELKVGTHGNANVSINGMWTAADTILKAINVNCSSAASCNRVLHLDPNHLGNVTVSVSNVTITGGRNRDNIGGAGILSGYQAGYGPDQTTLSNCVVTDNMAIGSASNAPGGGLLNIGGNLTITNCTFSNNSAGRSAGGAVYYDSKSPSTGTLTITDSTFTMNTVTNASTNFMGGGALWLTGATGTTYTISNSTFTSNLVTGISSGPVGGGAIYLSSGTLNLSGSTFTLNQANGPAATTAGGGAIQIGAGNANIQFSRIVGNYALNGPSGILNNDPGPATTSATDNWWGCNGGPGAANCDVTGGSVSFNPWIVLSHAASPNPVSINQATTLTASLLKDSAGLPLSPANLGALIGLPITFGNASLGNLSNMQTVIQPNGVATATFTAGSAGGAGYADATFDGSTVRANIDIWQQPEITSQVFLPLIQKSLP